ncbi:DUF4400 domain-containing protein [Comamonas sp. w2-DMI]|uniref:DUF4400 domain-containing protein n=1 Tax=Comamonas sp. w2-DMI TaxID=3126391 RepID=UPI0032E3AB0B
MNATHIRFWVFMIMVAFLLGPFYRTPKQMHSFVRSEAAITIDALGDTWGRGIVSKSAQLIKSGPVQLGVHLLKKGEYDQAQGESLIYKSWGTQIFMEYGNRLLAGWGAMLFVMCIRFMIVLCWFTLLAPMLIAACVDGIGQRKIRYYNFKSTRPTTHSALSLFVIPFALAPFVYLVLPFTISPAYLPMITSIMLLPLALLLAHSQPLFAER